jgi:hypothetical protein
MSRMVGVDWDNLAGLMDIPYSEREEIRANYGKYQSFSSKAEHIFKLFNDSKSYSRHILEKCFDELGRRDLKTEMLPVENEVSHNFEFSFSHDPNIYTSSIYTVPPNVME